MKSQFNYRSSASSRCPYPLETTPQTHYVNGSHKAVEIILLNRFGKKNIPPCIWWRLKDTPKEIYGAQKYLWGVVRRLEKTYDSETILNMVRRKNIKYLTPKMIARYLYWCKEEKDEKERLEAQKFRYYNIEEEVKEEKYFTWTCPDCKAILTQEDKSCPCKDNKNDNNLQDWIDS